MFKDLEAEEEPAKETEKESFCGLLRGQLQKIFQGEEND